MTYRENASMNALYPQLLRDALDVLDRHGADLGARDHTRSLDENPGELLRRVRVALQPLLLTDAASNGDVAEIVRRIDDMLRDEIVIVPAPWPHTARP
jgi:hypothetical protein